LKAQGQFIVGSVGGAAITFYLTVTIMHVELEFADYAMLVPTAFGFFNVVGYKTEVWLSKLSPRAFGSRWIITVLIGWCSNLTVGHLSGYAKNYPGNLWYAYAVGSLCIYIFTCVGVIRNFEEVLQHFDWNTLTKYQLPAKASPSQEHLRCEP
jgi:hypothetical protein